MPRAFRIFVPFWNVPEAMHNNLWLLQVMVNNGRNIDRGLIKTMTT